MRVGFVVNRLAELRPEQTTRMLMDRAARRGDEVWAFDVDQLGQAADGEVIGLGVSGAARRVVALDAFDALIVRTNPARDPDHAWAHQAALLLLRVLRRRGVRVANDPEGLAWATSKLHLATLPADVRPRTLVSRDPDVLRAFVEAADGDVVLKPITGTRGRDVFRIRRDRRDNLAQIFDVLTRDGLAMAQDFVPEAVEGDVRLLILDGRLLEVGGRAAAVRRVPPPTDFRSNVACGGTAAPVPQPTDAMRHVAAVAGPLLHADGLRFAGLDLVGDKVVEINVFSPGGLWEAEGFYGVDFCGVIVDALTS